MAASLLTRSGALRCLPLREHILNTSLLCAGGGGGNRRRGPPSYPMQCLGGTPHVSPSGYDWRDGVRPRSYRGTRPRSASGTLMSLSDDTAPPRTLGYPRWRAVFSGSALRVSHGRSPMRSEERAERPGDGCPCVGAEETCGVPPKRMVRNEDEYRFPRATAHLVQNKRGAASHLGRQRLFR